MYSPGSLKVAEVEAVPLTPPPPASTLASSTVGFASLKVTTPGPRNLLHVRTTGGVFGGFIPKIVLASSETHRASVSGLPTAVEKVSLIGRGPCTEAPPSNRIVGGVFPLASTKGETSHSGSRLAGTTVVWPLATIVHVSFLAPKSLGTVMVNTPHCRPGKKCVGWPWSGPPGSIRLLGPTGMSKSSFRLRL